MKKPFSENATALLSGSEENFIRIPVWGHIPIDQNIKEILSHPSFLRLKGIRQLSFAHHVFPGANHTRFEHSIGVYHLTKLILRRMTTSSLCRNIKSRTFVFDKESSDLILLSALLHDIGHYPHAHVIENVSFENKKNSLFDHHQNLARHHLFDSSFGRPLAEIIFDRWNLDANKIVSMIEGKKTLPFRKIISGTLDPDKMDYIIRDAYHCNVPYGNIDISRLIESLVPDPERKRLAITEKGIAPLESLMFAKYMMMRNVYWHHTTRAFSAMLKHAIYALMTENAVSKNEFKDIFYFSSDETSLDRLFDLATKKNAAVKKLISDILYRRPYKRAIDLYLGLSNPKWLSSISSSIEKKSKIQKKICDFLNKKHSLSIQEHEIIIDTPMSKNIFDYDDFQELHLYMAPSKISKGKFFPFNSIVQSAFKSDFIIEFSVSTKRLFIFAHEKIFSFVKANRAEVLEIVSGRPFKPTKVK